MIKHLYLVLFLMFLSALTLGQNREDQLDEFIDRFNNAYQIGNKEAEDVITDLEAFANTNRYEYAKAHVSFFKGLLYLRKLDFVKSLESFNKAIPIFEKEDDYCNVQSSYFNIATIFDELGDKVRAINYYRLSENYDCDYESEMEDDLYLLFNLITTFYEMGLDTLAKNNIDKILALDLDHEEEMFYFGMANYFKARYLLEEHTDTASAINLLKVSIAKNEPIDLIDSKQAVFYAASDLSLVYQQIGYTDSMLYYNSMAQNILNNLPYEDIELKLFHKLNQTLIALDKKDLDECMENLRALNQMLTNTPQLESRRRDIYEVFIEVFEEINDRDSILKYTQLQLESTDNQKRSELKYQALLLEVDDQTRNLSFIKENALRKERRMLIIIIAALAILVIIIPIAIIAKSRQKTIAKSNEILQIKNAEIEEKNNALEQLNTEKDQILRLLSHDIRTPLSNIQGILQVYSEGLLSDDELKSYTDMAQKNLDQLQLNLDNLIKWAMSQMQGAKANPAPCLLESCINQALSLIDIQAKAKNIEIELEPFGQQVEILADRDHIALIIRNLVSNAIKFSPKGSKVNISISEPKRDEVILSIKDNGVGMKIDKWESIEAASIKATKGTDGEGGYGIGLKMVKHYARLNNIDISMVPKADGGTIFELKLQKTMN